MEIIVLSATFLVCLTSVKVSETLHSDHSAKRTGISHCKTDRIGIGACHTNQHTAASQHGCGA